MTTVAEDKVACDEALRGLRCGLGYYLTPHQTRAVSAHITRLEGVRKSQYKLERHIREAYELLRNGRDDDAHDYLRDVINGIDGPSEGP